MVKINDTTTFPNTAPALTDHVPGTDVSNTANDANGETVTFTWQAAMDLFEANMTVPTSVSSAYRTSTILSSQSVGEGASLIGVEAQATDLEDYLSTVAGELSDLAPWSTKDPEDYALTADLPVREIDAGGNEAAARPVGDYVGIWTNHNKEVPTNADTDDIYFLPSGTVIYDDKAASFNFADSNRGQIVRATTGTLTGTIDTNANVPIGGGSNPCEIYIENESGNDLTITAASGVTLNGTGAASVTVPDDGIGVLIWDSADTWRYKGDSS